MTATSYKPQCSISDKALPNKALLIDDNAVLLRVLSEFLQQRGYEITRVKTLQDVESLMAEMPEDRLSAANSNEDYSALNVYDRFETQITALVEQLMPHLPEGLSVKQALYPLFERPLIKQAMIDADYSQVKAAKRLGMNRNTLRAKLKQLGMYYTL